jgi:hypothetical protein
MAGLWCVHCYRRQTWYCYFTNPHLVHLYFISYNGLSIDYLFHPCFLDEYKKVYYLRAQESFTLLVKSLSDDR